LSYTPIRHFLAKYRVCKCQVVLYRFHGNYITLIPQITQAKKITILHYTKKCGIISSSYFSSI